MNTKKEKILKLWSKGFTRLEIMNKTKYSKSHIYEVTGKCYSKPMRLYDDEIKLIMRIRNG